MQKVTGMTEGLSGRITGELVMSLTSHWNSSKNLMKFFKGLHWLWETDRNIEALSFKPWSCEFQLLFSILSDVDIYANKVTLLQVTLKTYLWNWNRRVETDMVMNYWRIYYNLMTSVKYVEYELFPKTMTIFQIWIK